MDHQDTGDGNVKVEGQHFHAEEESHLECNQEKNSKPVKKFPNKRFKKDSKIGIPGDFKSLEFTENKGGDDSADIVYYICFNNFPSWLPSISSKARKPRRSSRKKPARVSRNEIESICTDVCKVCTKKCDSWESVKEHIKNTHLFGVFQCPNCQEFKCEFAEMLFRHFKDEHCGKNLKCPDKTCPTSFTREQSFSDFSEHFKAHFPNLNRRAKPAFCDVCLKWMSSKQALEGHINAHKGIKAFKCKDCDFSTTYACSLRDHQAIHGKEKELEQFVCDQCQDGEGVSFPTKYQLNHHILYNHSDTKGKFNCNFCGEWFVKQGSLRKHKSKHHNGVHSAVCHVCGFVALVLSDLRSHFKTHMNDVFLSEEELNPLHQSGDSTYVCETCGFIAGTLKGLKHHKRSH